MQVQVDRATTWNNTIDRMGDNRAMRVLQGSILQLFGQANLWQRLKDFLVGFPTTWAGSKPRM